MTQVIDFRTDPAKYRHWRVTYHGDVANLIMDVIKDRNLSAVIRPTKTQTKEVEEVAHWLEEAKGVKIKEMLPELDAVEC